jgi:hypothetical protein
MPTAWADEEDLVGEDGWGAEDETVDAEDEAFSEEIADHLAAAGACNALYAWLGPARHSGWSLWTRPEAVRAEMSTDWTRLLRNSLAHDHRAGEARLADVLDLLRVAINELDAEPAPPAAEVGSVAEQLSSLVARLNRLRDALPRSGATLAAQDATSYPLIDWRAVNERQSKGWPNGLRDENGATLKIFKPTSYGTVVRERDDDN